MSSIIQNRINSIFSGVDIKREYIKMPYSSYTSENPYSTNINEEVKVFEITYKSSKKINNIDELEFQIANDYFIKKFGICIDDLKINKLKELYPEIFLI